MNERNDTTPAWGAWPAGEGQVRFALWAPDARSVEVVFDDGARIALQAAQDGFFSAVIECAADARYRYSVDGGEPV
ncbi:malto-oligosyltrehalose trehalohydrolase, partial [Xanthomonas citri pv. citri]|nr:malto-oligosyltrehalose trehalohydrolase [Xanthomonas citri pv. citri]